jgi:hypothetical protein
VCGFCARTRQFLFLGNMSQENSQAPGNDCFRLQLGCFRLQGDSFWMHADSLLQPNGFFRPRSRCFHLLGIRFRLQPPCFHLLGVCFRVKARCFRCQHDCFRPRSECFRLQRVCFSLQGPIFRFVRASVLFRHELASDPLADQDSLWEQTWESASSPLLVRNESR